MQRLFDHFGWGDNALVILAADHGEEFNEHGGWQHGFTLYQEIVHVPLVFRLPGGGHARRVFANSSLIDVLPTLRELLGTAPSDLDAGTSFAAQVLTSARPDTSNPRVLFGHLERRRSATSAAILERFAMQGRWKYITSQGDAGEQLFQLRDDPREQNNLATSQADRGQALRQALEQFETAAPRSPSETIQIEASAELLDELKALGYVK